MGTPLIWGDAMTGEWIITAIGWEPCADDLLKNGNEIAALITDLEQQVESLLRERMTARGHWDGQRLVEAAG